MHAAPVFTLQEPLVQVHPSLAQLADDAVQSASVEQKPPAEEFKHAPEMQTWPVLQSFLVEQ